LGVRKGKNTQGGTGGNAIKGAVGRETGELMMIETVGLGGKKREVHRKKGGGGWMLKRQGEFPLAEKKTSEQPRREIIILRWGRGKLKRGGAYSELIENSVRKGNRYWDGAGETILKGKISAKTWEKKQLRGGTFLCETRWYRKEKDARGGGKGKICCRAEPRGTRVFLTIRKNEIQEEGIFLSPLKKKGPDVGTWGSR